MTGFFEGTRKNILHLFRALAPVVYFAELAYTGLLAVGPDQHACTCTVKDPYPWAILFWDMDFFSILEPLHWLWILVKHYEESTYDFYHGGPVYLLNSIETENTVTETESGMARLLFNKPITWFVPKLNSSYSLTALIYTMCIIMNESKTSMLNLTVIACFNIFSVQVWNLIGTYLVMVSF